VIQSLPIVISRLGAAISILFLGGSAFSR
jgi:hypothetical protein